jgi:hypothetical protein
MTLTAEFDWSLTPPAGPTVSPTAVLLNNGLRNSWRWLVVGLDGSVKTNLDKLAINQSMEFVLDAGSQVTCDVPSDNPEIYRHANDGEPFVSYGRRLLYGLRREEPPGGNPWVVRFSGVMTINEDQADEDEPVTHITGNDAWTWAKSLPVLTPGGTLLPEKGYTYEGKTGAYIAKDVIANAYAWIYAQWGPPPFPWPPGTGGGGASALFINITDGNFDATDVLPSFQIQQGASVADVWTQLAQTGGVDVVLDPIYEPHDQPGVLSVMNVYAQAGTDRPNAVFGWDMFPRNLIGVDDLLDGTQIENWVQFFAGGNVATDPSGAGNPYHAASQISIEAYGPYFASQNISGPSSAAAVGLLAAAEVALRKRGKQTLTIDPTPEMSPDPFTQYGLGDTVYVWGGREMPPASSGPLGMSPYGSALRHGLRSLSATTDPSGPAPPSPHRVYGFQIDLANDIVETVTNLLLTDPNAASIS